MKFCDPEKFLWWVSALNFHFFLTVKSFLVSILCLQSRSVKIHILNVCHEVVFRALNRRIMTTLWNNDALPLGFYWGEHPGCTCLSMTKWTRNILHLFDVRCKLPRSWVPTQIKSQGQEALSLNVWGRLDPATELGSRRCMQLDEVFKIAKLQQGISQGLGQARGSVFAEKSSCSRVQRSTAKFFRSTPLTHTTRHQHGPIPTGVPGLDSIVPSTNQR